MAETGTGLPLLKSEPALVQPGAVAPMINSELASNASAWQEIAKVGAKVSDISEGLMHQAQVGYLADQDVEIARQRAILRDQHADNPDAFDAAWKGYTDGKLGAAEPWAVPHIKKVLGTEGNAAYSAILGERRAKDGRLDSERISALAALSGNDVIGSAMAGTFNSPDGQAKLEKYKGVLASAVTARLMAPEEAQRRLVDITNRAGAEIIVKDIGDTYRAARADGETAGPLALKAAEDRILRGDLPLSEDQRYAYFHKATAEIRALEAERKQDLGVARAAMQDAMYAMARGIKVDPGALDSISEQLNKAGGQADVAKLRGAAARAEQMSSFGRLPLDQQTQQYQTAAVTSRINATPFEGALIGRESSGSPALVNKLGYAGLYQFGAPRMAALGVYTPGQGENLSNWSSTPKNAPAKWSGTFNIPGFPDVKTLPDFLGNPEAQKAAFEVHRARMDQEIASAGLNRFEGQTVGGVQITRAGLYGMIHLAGAEGARKTLESGGAINPSDVNGTKALDYARLGSGKPVFGPGIDYRFVAGAQKELGSTADKEWTTIKKSLDDGIRPTPAALDTVIRAYSLTGNHDKLEEIGSRIDRFDARFSAARAPQAVTEGAATELRRMGETQGLTPGQDAWLKDLKAVNTQTAEKLKTDPVGLGVDRFPERFKTPAPLDLRTSDSLQAGLRERAAIAQFVAQNYQTPAMSALRPADIQQIHGALEAADPRGKARIYGDIAAALPENVRHATLAKLGEKDPKAMVEVYAGSLYAQDPNVAESILRGQTAIKADVRNDPRHEDAKRMVFDAALDTVLPEGAFSVAGRTSANGAYATIKSAAIARYADLTAQDPNSKHDFSESRLQQAVTDVTGGVLTHNGGSLIAPRRGMNQAQFDATVWNLTDADLSGASTLSGTPVTADYLRSNARLESSGDGRYLVMLGRDPAKPIYAFQYANTESPVPFELDLRNRPIGASRPLTGSDVTNSMNAGGNY